MAELLNNEYFVWGVTALIVFGITQGLKWLFVKPFTKNLPQKKKNIINSVILIIGFAVAVGIDLLYSSLWLNTTMSFSRALSGWGGASTVFAIYERIVKFFKEDAVVENPFETDSGKATTEMVSKVVADKKIDGNDKSAIKEFYEKVK